MSAELVEVVDQQGRVLRIVTRAEMRAQVLRHRTVFIAVVDLDGTRLLVHRRADWKDLWPSAWDLAFGGVAAPGEAWADAARRELAEEAGVVVDLVRVGGAAFDAPGVAELAEVFLARSDGPFSCPDGEVAEVAWVPLVELHEWLDGRSVCPDGVALVLPHLPAAVAPGPADHQRP